MSINPRYKAHVHSLANKFDASFAAEMTTAGLAFSKPILKRSMNPAEMKATRHLELLIQTTPMHSMALDGPGLPLREDSLPHMATRLVTPSMQERRAALMVFNDFSAILAEDITWIGERVASARLHTTPLSVRPKNKHVETGQLVMASPTEEQPSCRTLMIDNGDVPHLVGDSRYPPNPGPLKDFVEQLDREAAALLSRFAVLPAFRTLPPSAEVRPGQTLSTFLHDRRLHFGQGGPFMLRDGVSDHDSHLPYITWRPDDPDVIRLEEALQLIVEITACEFGLVTERRLLHLDVLAASPCLAEATINITAPKSVLPINGQTIADRIHDLTSPLLARFQQHSCVVANKAVQHGYRIATAQPSREAPSAHGILSAYQRLEALTSELSAAR